MAQRFTDTEKWHDSWFLNLSAKSKALFEFLRDNCDLAGFWERHDKTIESKVNLKIEEIPELFKELEKSAPLKGGVIFLKNFIRCQKNLPLNMVNNSHITIKNQLLERSELFGDFYKDSVNLSVRELRGLQAPYKPLARGPGIGKGKGKGKGISKEGGVGETKFVKPEPQEVTEYAKSIGYELDGEKFCNYYESKGWLIGKSKIKSWKACVRTWKGNEKTYIPIDKSLPLSKVILAWKLLQGAQIDDDTWDKGQWKITKPTAQKLLDFFSGDHGKAIMCMNHIKTKMDGLQRTCTIETILKHSQDWRYDNDKRNDSSN